MFEFQKMLWSGALLLSLLSGALDLQGQSVTGHSLTCYWCYSTTSWEDCDKKTFAVNCTTGTDDVCIKLKRTEWLDTENGSQKQKVHYSRGCNIAEACSDKECREKGWVCTVQCCSSDLCNTGVNTLASFILIAAFPCLAFQAFFSF